MTWRYTVPETSCNVTIEKCVFKVTNTDDRMEEIMTKHQKEVIKDNLQAFVSNFGPVRIEKEDCGKGFYVYSPENADSYVQYCHNIDYLDGWLYGCVQAANNRVKPIWKE